jgi:hypothetical protein
VSNIYVRAKSADEWAALLADPVKHWKSGYSARTLAHSWQDALGFPVEVASALRSEPLFADIELLIAMPEHQVPLPGGARPSQNDIWALARAGENLVSIAVEGKVDEAFGPTLDEWLSDPSPGKSQRLAFLREQLGLGESLPGALRYQLLHRTASAIIEAKRFCAPQAVMLLHSFSKTRQWFGGYAAFAALLGAKVEVDRTVSLGQHGGVALFLCWVCGNEDYLQR